MAHRKKAARSSRPAEVPPQGAGEASAEPLWTARRLVLAVTLLLTFHVTLAVRSLVLENPTVDEVVHLPAGITYWQTGSFRLYHHNPPLIKLIAALPVLGMDDLRVPYDSKLSGWNDEPPNKAAFAHAFLQGNAGHYFELFARARLMIPLFSVLGGLVVFFWAKSLYGAGGGLLSLALWIVCPNILAHCRLVTTDVGATALGALATYVFWHYLKRPTWLKAVLAGLCLGIAQLSKFSLILLYGIWPLLGVVHWLANVNRGAIFKGLAGGLGRWALMFVLSIFVIDAGYAFEGVGIPLGKYEFVNKAFVRDVPPGMWRPSSPDPLLNGAYHYTVNRFRGTWLDPLPVPLPKHYMLGFDDQKLEADGVPEKYLDPKSNRDEPKGYPVYLDGELRQKSWWYYYFLTLIYKVPEGTWALVLASLVVMVTSSRSRASWFDELTVLIMPAVILFVMSVYTNINIGLRYVLPIFPYVFISAGKLVPWAAGMKERAQRRAAGIFVGVSLAATCGATLWIAPHFLAYFNVVSGGPSNGSAHLIDSNLDWGQDLVGLKRWLDANAPGERVGLAYFGQINPNVFWGRKEGGFPWFLPPPLPGTTLPEALPKSYAKGRLEPGLYAVSASLVRGLPWRVYDDELPRWAPRSVWIDAYAYFQELTPFAKIGYSIFLYRVTPEQAERLSRHWQGAGVRALSTP